MKRFRCLFPLVAAAVLWSGAGCHTLQDDFDDCMWQLRTKCAAETAWWQYGWSYDVDHKCDFSRGFKHGYRHVALGGDGCPPPLPPRCYWSACHAGPPGQGKARAWYEGFGHGVIVAHQDGRNQWNEIFVLPSSVPYGPPGPIPELVPTGDGGPYPAAVIAPEGLELYGPGDLPSGGFAAPIRPSHPVIPPAPGAAAPGYEEGDAPFFDPAP